MENNRTRSHEPRRLVAFALSLLLSINAVHGGEEADKMETIEELMPLAPTAGADLSGAESERPDLHKNTVKITLPSAAAQPERRLRVVELDPTLTDGVLDFNFGVAKKPFIPPPPGDSPGPKPAPDENPAEPPPASMAGGDSGTLRPPSLPHPQKADLPAKPAEPVLVLTEPPLPPTVSPTSEMPEIPMIPASVTMNPATVAALAPLTPIGHRKPPTLPVPAPAPAVAAPIRTPEAPAPRLPLSPPPSASTPAAPVAPIMPVAPVVPVVPIKSVAPPAMPAAPAVSQTLDDFIPGLVTPEQLALKFARDSRDLVSFADPVPASIAVSAPASVPVPIPAPVAVQAYPPPQAFQVEPVYYGEAYYSEPVPEPYRISVPAPLAAGADAGAYGPVYASAPEPPAPAAPFAIQPKPVTVPAPIAHNPAQSGSPFHSVALQSAWRKDPAPAPAVPAVTAVSSAPAIASFDTHAMAPAGHGSPRFASEPPIGDDMAYKPSHRFDDEDPSGPGPLRLPVAHLTKVERGKGPPPAALGLPQPEPAKPEPAKKPAPPARPKRRNDGFEPILPASADDEDDGLPVLHDRKASGNKAPAKQNRRREPAPSGLTNMRDIGPPDPKLFSTSMRH